MLLKSVALLAAITMQSVTPQSMDEGHGQLTVTKGHKPSAKLQECLSAPTRKCAIAASLDTVINEEMGIERAKVLTALAEALLDMQNKDQAEGVLAMAVEESRSVGISIVLQMTLKDIVPLYARLGEVDTAFDLISEMQFELTRDEALKEMATNFAAIGDFASMQRSLDGITNKDKAFWFQIDVLKRSGHAVPATLLASISVAVDALTRYDLQYRGKSALAALKTKSNDSEGAKLLWDALDADFVKISGNSTKAQFAAIKSADMAFAKVSDSILDDQLEFAQTFAARVKSNSDHQILAGYLGPVEIMRGQDDVAVNRGIFFTTINERIKFYLKLAKVKKEQSIFLKRAIHKDLIEIGAVDGAYERDALRYYALRAAYKMKDVALMKEIIKAIEDDDNQARGAALLAALLPE